MSENGPPPAKKRPKAQSHSESYRGKFMAVFQGLLHELVEDVKNPEVSDGIQHLQEVRAENIIPGDN